MKTFDKIFDAIDNIFKVVVMFLFGAMVLGFASCTDEDEEDENDCNRNCWSDNDVAEAYAKLVANGHNVDDCWIGNANGGVILMCTEKEEIEGQFNLICNGFNEYISFKNISVDEFLDRIVFNTKKTQERMFGAIMFTQYNWNKNKETFTIYFNDYKGVYNYNEKGFALESIEKYN